MTMQTLQSLRDHIRTTESLGSIVRTMKSLAAVSIHQYERAAEAIADYDKTLQLALHVLFRNRPHLAAGPQKEDANGAARGVVFGSDHGLCGRFNEDVSDFTVTKLNEAGAQSDSRALLVVGSRAGGRLQAMGEHVLDTLQLPGSVTGIAGSAGLVLERIEQWQSREPPGQVLLFHNVHTQDDMANPEVTRLLPVDAARFESFAAEEWPSRRLPTFTMDVATLFKFLIRQHLFVTVYRALAESLASEQASRLASMQAAERNIDEHLEEARSAYRQRRQQAITAELLDVVAGYEAVQKRG